MKEAVERMEIKVGLESDNYYNFRGMLFRSGVSFTEFFNYVVGLSMKNDPRVLALISEASKEKPTIPKTRGRTTAAEIFNLLERTSPFNKKEGI